MRVPHSSAFFAEGWEAIIASATFFAVLYSFTGGNDGSGPRSVLTRDSSGNLYGTTIGGGNSCGAGCGGGTVYEITP